MSSPIAYGIDFGTTNSQVAVTYDDSIDVIAHRRTDSLDFPSLVYLHRDGNRASGTGAVQQYLITGSNRTACVHCDAKWDCRQYRNRNQGCNDARLLAGIKNDLSDDTLTSTHSWGVDFALEELVAVVLRRLKQLADEHTGQDVDRVILGHPALYVGAEGKRHRELQALAEHRMEKAALSAGFREVELYAEPSAALEEEVLDHGSILAVDFGGGTFDAAVIDMPRRPGEVVGLAGAPIGGQNFDALIFNKIVAPALGINSTPLKNRLQTLSHAWHILNDARGRELLRASPVMEEVIFGGFAFDFYRAIENAKIQLSRKRTATITLERGRTVDINIEVSRDDLEALVHPHLDALRRVILDALGQANHAPQDIDFVITTGGSAAMPAFKAILHDLFGKDRIQARPPFTAVVQGLGRRAQEIWG